MQQAKSRYQKDISRLERAMLLNQDTRRDIYSAFASILVDTAEKVWLSCVADDLVTWTANDFQAAIISEEGNESA
jgi:hypothetical protein